MGQYDKYFIQETKPNLSHVEYMKKKGKKDPYIDRPIAIDDEADGKVPGAFYFMPHIVTGTSSRETYGGGDIRPQMHDWDEYLLYMGFDPEHPEELGGEVEFWMEGEKHVFDKTTVIFIPAYFWHCPVYILRVDRPFGFIAHAKTVKYSHLQFHPDPKYANDYMIDEIAEVKFGNKKYQVTKSHLEYIEYMKERGRKHLPNSLLD